MSITDFLNARIAEDEEVARALLDDLEAECQRNFKNVVDERGPMTPLRLLKSQMWAHFAGQTRERNFAKGQHIATLANPARVLAECAAKRAIVELHTTYTYTDEEPGFSMEMWDCMCSKQAGKPCPTIGALAAVYADHPAYLDEWRVGA